MKQPISFWGSFFEVWIHPRKVFRNLIDNDSYAFVWPFVLGYSFLSVTDPELFTSFLNKAPLSQVLLIGGLLVVPAMVGLFWFFTAFAYYTGKLMGGKGTFKAVTIAYAWCLPPAFIATLFNALASIPTWNLIFSGATDEKAIMFYPKAGWQVLFSGLYYVLILWSLVLDFFAVSEAHRFSMGKSIAIGAIALAMVLFIGIGIGIVMALIGGHP